MRSEALPDGQNRKSDFEVLGEWETASGNRLMLKARRKSGYASIWLDYNGHPVKIGYALHAGGVVRSIGWEPLWGEQTEAWKTQQRNHIAALIASWHADDSGPAPLSPLPASVVGVFDLDGFRFAVESTSADEHAVLSVISTSGGLAPIADLLHDKGHVSGLITRPGWTGTPDERKRRWRIGSEEILQRAARNGRL
jgi:hypothetical protein